MRASHYKLRLSLVLNSGPVSGTSGAPGKLTVSDPPQSRAPVASLVIEPVPANGVVGASVAKLSASSVAKLLGRPLATARRWIASRPMVCSTEATNRAG